MEKGAVFPLFYLPPIEYFSKILIHKENILFEDAENFQNKAIETAQQFILQMENWI